MQIHKLFKTNSILFLLKNLLINREIIEFGMHLNNIEANYLEIFI